MTVEEALAAAMQLDQAGRAALVLELLEVADRPEALSQADVDAAWTAEIARRVDAVASGKMEGLTLEQVEERFEAAAKGGEPRPPGPRSGRRATGTS
jgi:putative addiction module component (TIGR02574 family)